MKTVVVVQARTGSSRLPRKVLLPLGGRTLLERMVERIRAATTPFAVVVATTTDPADDAIASLCATSGIACYRGHATDLVDRHLNAARMVDADIVVKIPSDCPLVDPGVIDRVLSYFAARHGRIDYASNLHPASYPDGNDVEVMTLRALRTAFREARRPHEREHTTPYLWDNPERFAIGNVAWESGRNLSATHRLTIDYAEDYELIRAVFDALYTPERPVFSLDEIVALLDARPDLRAINERWHGVSWYRHHLGELRTVRVDETRVA